MLANPYVYLATLLAFLAAAAGAYHFGKHVCEGEHATDVAAVQVEIIDRANRDTELATARAVAQAKAEAAARLSATTIRLKGERDAAIKARPECLRDADSQRLLNDAIAVANGDAPAASPVPDPVRPAAGPGVGE